MDSDVCFKVKGETMDKLEHIITRHVRRIDKARTTLHHDGCRIRIARAIVEKTPAKLVERGSQNE